MIKSALTHMIASSLSLHPSMNHAIFGSELVNTIAMHIGVYDIAANSTQADNNPQLDTWNNAW